MHAITKRITRRFMIMALPAIVVVAAASTAAAYACTNLATLDLSAPSGAPGTALSVTGSSFTPNLPVVLHWNSLTGPALATVNAGPTGSIAASVTVPSTAQPGDYVIVATENSHGQAAFGTPARATFQVIGPSGASSVQSAVPAANPLASIPASSGSGVSTGLLAATVALGVLGLGLFGLGAAGYVRQRRRATAPAGSTAEK